MIERAFFFCEKRNGSWVSVRVGRGILHRRNGAITVGIMDI
jgi:hypothetical protein